MRGYPHYLNSRQDYINIIDDFGHGELVERAYQGLLNSATHYQFDKVLEEGEEPTGTEPEYRVMEDEVSGRVQYKLVENPNGKIFKLGFTVEEVEEVIEKCSN